MSGPTSEAIERRESRIARAIILVEGVSDRRALEALAGQRGRDLTDDGVSVVAMDGAGNIGRFLDRYGPSGSGVALAGLYDPAEEATVRHGLEARPGSTSNHASICPLPFTSIGPRGSNA